MQALQLGWLSPSRSPRMGPVHMSVQFGEASDPGCMIIEQVGLQPVSTWLNTWKSPSGELGAQTRLPAS